MGAIFMAPGTAAWRRQRDDGGGGGGGAAESIDDGRSRGENRPPSAQNRAAGFRPAAGR